VISSVLNLSKTLNTGKPMSLDALRATTHELGKLAASCDMPPAGKCVIAEIHVYEPHVTRDGETEWRKINIDKDHFSAEVLGVNPDGAKQKAALIKNIGDLMKPPAIERAQAMDLARDAINQPTVHAAVAQAFDPAADVAALQNLPVYRPRTRLLDCLFPRPKVANTAIIGPSVSQ
jgi:hypothetical protein